MLFLRFRMMTSTQIRQSFLDFFKSKAHTIVPSSSLMPDSPNLLFTNAGMNQFVPIFLGQTKCPYTPGRAADTQKCIRAGGKHNDLDDVGLDTYHHTFFEMLGNWSFGDYFKKEAIEWAWELVVNIWKFPPQRLYATVYNPDKSKNDPSEFDLEAFNFWAEKFRSVGLDPGVHIVNGNKKDNFWMMGETGPCGPCSELHVDLTPAGDTKGSLVNKGTAECIEIWNLVFMQFNANPDGTFSPLPAKAVDTGMGFERVTSIIQGTQNLTDFANAKISNYETDIFRPIFDKLEEMSGKTYGSTLPGQAGGQKTPLGTPPEAPIKTSGEGPSRITEVGLQQHPAEPDPTCAEVAAQASGECPAAIGADWESLQAGLEQLRTDLESLRAGSEPRRTSLETLRARSEQLRLGLETLRMTSEQLRPTSEQRRAGLEQLRTSFETLRAEVEQLRAGSETRHSHSGEQIAIDIAFRVIADHIRTLSFAIADGIQPGNTDRNYVLRRILRRAVRYGRTLGFKEPFFYKLVDVLADTMGDIFPEIRARKKQVQETIQREEEAFNKTLDRGIELFNDETAKLSGSAPAPGAADRALAVGLGVEGDQGAKYSKRRLPHFERPWGKYMVTFSTRERRQLNPAERDMVLESILYAHTHRQYQLFAACVMPDHVHLLFEPQIKEQDKEGKPVFYPLGEILHGIKSTTAHKINKAAKVTGVHVWEEESFDRLMRGDSDLEEKFHYICGNPWDNGVVPLTENYRWLWTPDAPVADDVTEVSREGAGNSARGGRAPQANVIGGDFAFKLYDTYGFPLDLTELMARERGLTVDKEGFEKLMEEQRARARAAQKKEVISLSQIETTTPTKFVGYDHSAVEAKVLEVVSLKDKTAVILDSSACYAEMGGQVGDTGELTGSGQLWRVTNTQKSGNTFLHFVEGGDAPAIGAAVTLAVEKSRRDAIQRHHTVTHLLHWALHEVASKEASQKGSFVGPDKLTFDFNSAPLTPAQVADIEKLVNERILENAGVSWTEVAHADVKNRKDVMQFFGDKYGDTVRVVQIGGGAHKLDGYSMELCGGTHTRATGEIGLFRIVGESAIAAGVRRIEAIAGLEAYGVANAQLQLIRSLAGKINSPVGELEKKIEAMLAQQKELEKQVKAAQQREASNAASELLERVHAVNGTPAIIHNVGGVDGEFLQAVADALKSQFKGVVVLGGAANGAVTLIASVSADFTAKIQAGKIIQQIAPIVGGKGGGKPDNARGGGKDAAKLDEALAKAKSLL
jgi:alanyl-tRNA synthetase/REP element-mobilizing transposase RayT